MNLERVREFLLSLPHVVETEQWGGSLLYWVGDKAVGGKLCAIMSLENRGVGGLIAYPTDAERFAELVEMEGIEPAKYLARLKWVSVTRWDAFRWPEWQEELRAAHAMKLEKLPPKTLKVLALPKSEQKRVVAQRRKALAMKARVKKQQRG